MIKIREISNFNSRTVEGEYRGIADKPKTQCKPYNYKVQNKADDEMRMMTIDHIMTLPATTMYTTNTRLRMVSSELCRSEVDGEVRRSAGHLYIVYYRNHKLLCIIVLFICDILVGLERNDSEILRRKLILELGLHCLIKDN